MEIDMTWGDTLPIGSKTMRKKIYKCVKCSCLEGSNFVGTSLRSAVLNTTFEKPNSSSELGTHVLKRNHIQYLPRGCIPSEVAERILEPVVYFVQR